MELLIIGGIIALVTGLAKKKIEVEGEAQTGSEIFRGSNVVSKIAKAVKTVPPEKQTQLINFADVAQTQAKTVDKIIGIAYPKFQTLEQVEKSSVIREVGRTDSYYYPRERIAR